MKDYTQNDQNRSYGEMTSQILETYKNGVMPHSHHIHKTSPHMAMEKLCPIPSDKHALPHRKCVLWCFSNCIIIFITGHNYDKYGTNIFPVICSHVNILVSFCKVHDLLTYEKKRSFCETITTTEKKESCTFGKDFC